MNVEIKFLIIKFTSTVMQGKRKLCECHTRLFFPYFILQHRKFQKDFFGVVVAAAVKNNLTLSACNMFLKEHVGY